MSLKRILLSFLLCQLFLHKCKFIERNPRHLFFHILQTVFNFFPKHFIFLKLKLYFLLCFLIFFFFLLFLPLFSCNILF